MDRIWQFNTERFSVVLECEDERYPDLSWADAETLEKLENGTYVNVTFAVKVYCDGVEIASDYLGNSIYENVADFRDHIGSRGKGSYFTDMVRQAISEARQSLNNQPQLRAV